MSRSSFAADCLRSLARGLALALACALVAAPLGAQRGKKPAQEEPPADPELTAALGAWTAFWSELEKGVVDLHGQASDGKRAAAKREEYLALVKRLIAKPGGMDAAQRLWKAAMYEVDAAADQGALMIRNQPWFLRTGAREGLAKLDPAVLLPFLDQQLAKRGKTEADDPRLAAIEVLGMMGGDGARSRLLALAAVREAPVQLEVVRALATLPGGDPELVTVLLGALKTGDLPVKLGAIHALAGAARPFLDETLKGAERKSEPAGLGTQVVDAVGQRLVQDKSWQLRQAASSCLLRLRTRLAVPYLIEGLKAEKARLAKEKTAQVMGGLQEALYSLTGQEIPGDQIGAWEEFWKKNGSSMVILDAAKAPKQSEGDSQYLRYFNIDVKSKRVLFVVDRSGSMLEPANLKGKYANLAANDTKFAIVQKELERLVLSLPPDTQANLIFFSDDVRVWKMGKDDRPPMLTLDDRAKTELVTFLRLTAPAGATNVWDAMQAALGAAGRGLRDRYYETEFDTIYMLSDGAPTVGPVIDPEEILRHVRERNQLSQVVIHTITFGDVNDTVFMKRLATENGGRHVHIE
ncbi:MAG: VWA domain-containing protein [Planctomycetes bacterium]|nr:VWA domain-containing protein [Planctomycetota bacterium]